MSKAVSTDFKKSVLKLFLTCAEEQLNKFKAMEQDLLDAANMGDEDKESQIESPMEGMMEDVQIQGQSVDHFSMIVSNLKQVDPNLMKNNVEFGALVSTNNGIFLVAAPVAKTGTGSFEVTGISTQAPIFKAMEGKEEGDSFEFNQKKYKIDRIV